MTKGSGRRAKAGYKRTRACATHDEHETSGLRNGRRHLTHHKHMELHGGLMRLHSWVASAAGPWKLL